MSARAYIPDTCACVHVYVCARVRVMRMLVLRRLFIQKKKAVVVIQKRHRGNLGRARARDYVRVSAAENIQRVARGRHDQRMWKDLSDTVIVAQGMWRQKLAKRHVARMKAEEKDARVQMQKAAQAAQQAKEAAAAAEAAKLKVAQQEAERKQTLTKQTRDMAYQRHKEHTAVPLTDAMPYFYNYLTNCNKRQTQTNARKSTRLTVTQA